MPIGNTPVKKKNAMGAILFCGVQSTMILRGYEHSSKIETAELLRELNRRRCEDKNTLESLEKAGRSGPKPDFAIALGGAERLRF